MPLGLLAKQDIPVSFGIVIMLSNFLTSSRSWCRINIGPSCFLFRDLIDMDRIYKVYSIGFRTLAARQIKKRQLPYPANGTKENDSFRLCGSELSYFTISWQYDLENSLKQFHQLRADVQFFLLKVIS